MIRTVIIVLCCAFLAAGCSSARKKGGYYKDDGPGHHVPANIEAIPDAVPRIETHAPANLRPYVVLGQRYVPVRGDRPFRQTGIASWYGRKFHGKKTANGETYDMYAMTAAHPTLPLPSYARVTHARSGKSIIVRINDRGPFHSSRVIDLSYVAAAKLGLIGPGSGQVIVEAITHDDIRRNSYHDGTGKTPAPMPIPPATPSETPVLITRASPDVPAGTTPARQSGAAPATPDALAALDAAQHGGMPSAGPVMTAAPSAGLIYLQYGAFGSHDNARQLADSLNREIRHMETRPAEISHSASLHRVRIGPFASRTQAVNAALRIQETTGRPASIVQDADLPERRSTSL